MYLCIRPQYAGGNTLFESCGQYGESNVREVDLGTGAVRKRTDNDKGTFAEGLAMQGGRLHQIAWLTNEGASRAVQSTQCICVVRNVRCCGTR